MNKHDVFICIVSWFVGIILACTYPLMPEHAWIWAIYVFLGCLVAGPAIYLPINYFILWLIKRGAHHHHDGPDTRPHNIP